MLRVISSVESGGTAESRRLQHKREQAERRAQTGRVSFWVRH